MKQKKRQHKKQLVKRLIVKIPNANLNQSIQNSQVPPDIHSIEKDRKKRRFSKFRAWQKYCRVAKREGCKAYSKSRFYSLFHEYGSAGARFHVKKSKNIGDILGFTLLQSRYSNDATSFEFVEKQMDDWCKERRLDKYKIWDLRVAGF